VRNLCTTHWRGDVCAAGRSLTAPTLRCAQVSALADSPCRFPDYEKDLTQTLTQTQKCGLDPEFSRTINIGEIN
jgi:hypothetical protein